MSIFNPELKEFNERMELGKLGVKSEKRLRESLKSGKEVFSDLIQCPNGSCGNPLSVQLLKDRAELSCKSCGFFQIVPVDTD